jgi:hypothetical protein
VDITTLLLYVLMMVTAWPVGWALAWLTREELVSGKKWFKMIIYALVIVLAIVLLVWRDVPMSLALIYMILVTAVSLYKGNDKKFVK